MVSVMSHVPLANGCHYWKVRIDQFSGTGNNGFVAVGVAKEMEDEGVIGKMIKKNVLHVAIAVKPKIDAKCWGLNGEVVGMTFWPPASR